MANDAYAGGLSLSLDRVLAAVDYRVAPQTPAPGAAEDGLLAYTYLTGHASELGIDSRPYCSPGRATDLHGLPPAFIAVGQFDVFRDEDIDFARRLIAAGVPVDLHVCGTAYHSFDLMAPTTRLAREFTETWLHS